MNTWLICIDDTDDIDTKGTGEIAQEIAQKLVDAELGLVSPITRHQLYIHPDIPYTSHNSAMCFTLSSGSPCELIRSIAIEHLVAESALAADPGLAVVRLVDLEASPLAKAKLIQFGLEAKRQVKTKQQAYELAKDCHVSLSEHGGTGDGVIGALAGIGLRLTGQDGRMKGQVTLNGIATKNLAPTMLTVNSVLAASNLDAVVDIDGQTLPPESTLHLSGKLKAVFQNHQFVLPVYQNGQLWCNATRSQLKNH